MLPFIQFQGNRFVPIKLESPEIPCIILANNVIESNNPSGLKIREMCDKIFWRAPQEEVDD